MVRLTLPTAGVGFEPIRNLEIGGNAQYTNNLTGMLYQSYISSGVVLPQLIAQLFDELAGL